MLRLQFIWHEREKKKEEGSGVLKWPLGKGGTTSCCRSGVLVCVLDAATSVHRLKYGECVRKMLPQCKSFRIASSFVIRTSDIRGRLMKVESLRGVPLALVVRRYVNSLSAASGCAFACFLQRCEPSWRCHFPCSRCHETLFFLRLSNWVVGDPLFPPR